MTSSKPKLDVLAETFVRSLLERELPSNESLWEKAKDLAMLKFGSVPTTKGYKWANKWYHYKGGKWAEPTKREQIMRLERVLAEINAISTGGGAMLATGSVSMGNKSSAFRKRSENKKAQEKMWSNYKRDEEKH